MSSILEGLHTTQVLKEDAERLAQLEMAYRQAKEITKDIKYDDTVMGIVSRIQELGQKYNIDPRSIKYAISDVQEAKNNLESAIYGLDEVFKDAYEDLKWRQEDEENLQEISDFKRKEIEFELRHEKNNYAVSINGKVWKVFADEKQANNIARSLRNKGKDAKVYPTGAEVSEGYRAGAVGGAGLGIEKSPIEKVLEKPIKCSPVDEHINTPGGMGQAYRKFKPKSTDTESLYEYDDSLIDTVINGLPKGLTIDEFYPKAYADWLYWKYYRAEKQNFYSVAKDWYEEYKQKHNMKEYKTGQRAPMLIKDIDRIEDLLYTLPKGLDFNKFIDIALRQYISHKYGTKHWDEWKKKLRYEFWNAYQKAGKDKPEGVVNKIKGWFKEEQAPMFTPEDEAKMINANDPKSAGWRRTESSIMKGLQTEGNVITWSKDNPPPPQLLLNTLIQILMKPENQKSPQDLISLWNEKYGLKHTLGSLRQYAQNDYKKMELSKALQKSALANESFEGK